MGSLVALLAMLSAFVLWLFVKFQPELTPGSAQVRVLRVTNRMFLGLAAVLAVLWMLRIYTTYADPFEDPLVTQVAVAGALGLVAAVVGLGFLIRNFIVFKN